MRICYDASSFLWRALLSGKDTENGIKTTFEEKEILVNSALYGYDIVIDLILKPLEKYKQVPCNVIWVEEGMNSKSKRLLINKEYKATRDARSPEAYEQFEILRGMVRQTLLELGACVMSQNYAEGDDTLAWLAREMEEDLVIATYDNDLAALNGTNSYGAETETWIDGLTGVNKFGLFECHLITTYKALVGDTSDNIKGCVGFGPAMFEKFVVKYGEDGLQELHDLLLAGSLSDLHPMAADCKIIKKICDQEEGVLNSFELARLRPEWVNTMKSPLDMQAGMVRQLRSDDDLRLKTWYGRSRLVTVSNFEEAVKWAGPLIDKSEFVALDIETSTGEESDEWLARQGKEDGVDMLGSRLTGLGLTFGPNLQYSLYFSVDHAETDNIPSEKVRDFISTLKKKPTVVHNSYFELTVLFQEWGEEWKDNGCKGFLPNVLDTLYESSYVNENIPLSLKFRSQHYLGYKQVEYDEITTLSGPYGTLPKGGRRLKVWDEEGFDVVGTGEFVIDNGEECEIGATHESRKYKMKELTAQHVLGYGLDDTICTAGLHNYCKLVMQLEHTYNVYLEVELSAAYLHAQSFITGVDVSIEKLNELAAEDTITYDNAWKVVRAYLIEQGWEGTVCPVFTPEITPAETKAAFQIVTGRPMDTAMRTMSKLVTFCREVAEEPLFAGALQRLLEGSPETFNACVKDAFEGEPDSPVGSPKKMTHLLYEVMKLPVRVSNKLTDVARARGDRTGTPKTDALAISYAMLDSTEKQKTVLSALKLMQMVQTRRGLYYSPYPGFVHWKTGKIHSSHRQCSTNTRRASSASPNLQQLPKSEKIEGQAAKFRSVIVPHRPDAVIVSMDFAAQELRLIADYSKDPGLVACYVGDNLLDMHAMTAIGIVQRQEKDKKDWTYKQLLKVLADAKHPFHKQAKTYRVKSKAVNFGSAYGIAAEKLSTMLLVTEEEAQTFLDAKEAAFPVVEDWKSAVVKETKKFGLVRTKLGAVRHLRPALTSGDRFVISKAERQGINFEIQSSSAEQTKKAEGRMWDENLFTDYDARYIGPVHDETVVSVLIKDLPEFLPKMHRCMVAPYADMTIPIESSISFGKDFYNQIEIGTQPTKEAIEKGVAELINMLK